MNTPSLDSIKHDGPALFALLGIERAGTHCRCPFHGPDNKPSLSVWRNEAGWHFRCHASNCPAGNVGSIVDAVALIERIPPGKAIERLTGQRYTPPADSLRRVNAPPAPPPEPVPPVPNLEAVRRFVERAKKTLCESEQLQSVWLKKRGLLLDTVISHDVGFMPFARFAGWKHSLQNVWVIPITDARGNVVGVKLHRENAKTGPKVLWAPFGTQPADKPRHGFPTLWPPPEHEGNWSERAAIFETEGGFDRNEAQRRAGLDCGWLYLLPGELKALAVSGAGRAATSITGGENHRWTPGQIARLAGRKVCIVYDDDPAGHVFRDKTIQALYGAAVEVKAITFGRKVQSK